MGIKRGAYQWLMRRGFVVSRAPAVRLTRMMKAAGVTLALDVGANVGQFGLSLRDAGYSGRIVSFEPVSSAFDLLSHRVSTDPAWEAINVCLGDEARTATINVASNHAASSSLLEPTTAHLEAAPAVTFPDAEQVDVRRLDDVVAANVRAPDVLMLKIDTQGYERQVLAGADRTIQQAAIVHMEVSYVPLYAGSMLVRESLELMERLGFVLAGMDRGLTDVSTGQVVQGDATFLRPEKLAS